MVRKALLVGVSDYQHVTPLPAVRNDVLAMREVLIDPDLGEFFEDSVHTLIDAEAAEIREQIEELFSDCKKQDLILLYFSGHGFKDTSGNLYLAARNTRLNEQGEVKRSTAVECSFIHLLMSESASRQQIIMLDCCYSGAFAEGMRARGGSVDLKAQLQKGVEGRAILTASTALQESFEGQGAPLGVYTSYIVEGIKSGKADTDGNGEISVDELHEYAKERIRENFPKMKPEIYAIREGYKIPIAKVRNHNKSSLLLSVDPKPPMSVSTIEKRYTNKVLVEYAIRLIPKHEFKSNGLLGKNEREYVFIGDYEEQNGRTLRHILANLWMGDAFDRLSTSNIEWIAIIFEVGELNYRKLDLIPATWKAMFRIIADPNRLGKIQASDDEKRCMGFTPRDYYSDDQRFWYSCLTNRTYDGVHSSSFLSSLFGLDWLCFQGEGITRGKGGNSVSSRLFLVKNVSLSILNYTIQELGHSNKEIILK